MKKILRAIILVAVSMATMISCQKESQADKVMEEMRRVRKDVSNTTWTGYRDMKVYELKFLDGKYYLKQTVGRGFSTSGTYQQSGTTIIFDKKCFVDDYYVFMETGTISDNCLDITIPVKSGYKEEVVYELKLKRLFDF